MTAPTRRWWQTGYIDLIWPLLACAAGWRFIVQHLNDPVQWDPEYVYLPAARAFLEQGWAFLLTPSSYRTVPLAYLWPALWGADPAWIRVANMGLWAGCAYFLWRASVMLGGRRAGVAALALLLCSDLARYFPSEMTEPVWLFGVFGLIHALARLVIARERTWGAVAQGAVMLTITLLSRPILQLIAPALCLACLGVWGVLRAKGARGAGVEPLPRIAFGLGLGLLLPAAWVVKNGLLFGLWGLGTGAGVSLYQGTHPVFQGTEPPFLGFGADAGLLIAAALHTGADESTLVDDRAERAALESMWLGLRPLTLIGDRVTRAAGLWQIQTMPTGDMAAFFGRKLWWWLAHHPAELQKARGPGNILRRLRLFELATLAVTAWWVWRGWRRWRGQTLSVRSYATALVGGPTPRQWAFAAILLGMFALLVIQLLPILYNSRYSIYLLDPWLIPLTAFCLACMTRPLQLVSQNPWRIGLAAMASLVAIAAMTYAAYSLARGLERVSVDPRHIGKVAAIFDATSGDRVHASGMARQNEWRWVVTESPATLMVDVDSHAVERIRAMPLHNALWDTEIALHPADRQRQRCQPAEITWQTATGAVIQPSYRLPLLLPLNMDGKFHHLVTHANSELRPTEVGSLRIVLDCPTGTVVEWHRTQYLESRYIQDVAVHIKP